MNSKSYFKEKFDHEPVPMGELVDRIISQWSGPKQSIRARAALNVRSYIKFKKKTVHVYRLIILYKKKNRKLIQIFLILFLAFYYSTISYYWFTRLGKNRVYRKGMAQ